MSNLTEDEFLEVYKFTVKTTPIFCDRKLRLIEEKRINDERNAVLYQTELGKKGKLIAEVNSDTSLSPSKRVLNILCVGYVGIDYIASVATFPSKDDKIRTTSLYVTGGGNAGNTCCAISRLGVGMNINGHILSKRGTDANGSMVQQQLNDFHINTDYLKVSSISPTGFVYVIVDSDTKSRTCIATPMTDELTTTEIIDCVSNGILSNIDLIHLDSRHTLASIEVATRANELGIPVTIDVEKNRPYLDDLLPLCNIIFTNEAFTNLYFHVDDDGSDDDYGTINNATDAIVALFDVKLLRKLHYIVKLFNTCSKAETIVSTLGSAGSILLTKKTDSDVNGGDDTVRLIASASPLTLYSCQYVAFNRDSYKVMLCSALSIDPVAIVDTTGAGDAYIGGFLCGYVNGNSHSDCMKLGTLVASKKLRHKGARDGLPSIADLSP